MFPDACLYRFYNTLVLYLIPTGYSTIQQEFLQVIKGDNKFKQLFIQIVITHTCQQ